MNYYSATLNNATTPRTLIEEIRTIFGRQRVKAEILSYFDRLLYAKQQAGEDIESAWFRATHERIAAAIGRSLDYVRRNLRELVRDGWIEKNRPGNGWCANAWRVNLAKIRANLPTPQGNFTHPPGQVCPPSIETNRRNKEEEERQARAREGRQEPHEPAKPQNRQTPLPAKPQTPQTGFSAAPQIFENESGRPWECFVGWLAYAKYAQSRPGFAPEEKFANAEAQIRNNPDRAQRRLWPAFVERCGQVADNAADRRDSGLDPALPPWFDPEEIARATGVRLRPAKSHKNAPPKPMEGASNALQDSRFFPQDSKNNDLDPGEAGRRIVTAFESGLPIARMMGVGLLRSLDTNGAALALEVAIDSGCPKAQEWAQARARDLGIPVDRF